MPPGRVLKPKTRVTFNTPGEVHELTFSTYRRLPWLADSKVADEFLSSLDSARLALNLDVWAYVVMPDHCHVLIYPRDPEYRVAEMLRCLKASVARAAFELHPDWRALSLVRRAAGKIEGRFWQQGGGYDRNVRSGEATWKIIEYIHSNPVAKGLCERPSDWRWSSAGDVPGRALITKCPWWIS